MHFNKAFDCIKEAFTQTTLVCSTSRRWNKIYIALANRRAIFGPANHPSSALTFSLTGLFLVLIGFQQSLGGNQPPETISALRLGFILSPVIVYSLALLILRTYPLTPARMGEIRATLEARRGEI
jgi:hypothetical protein